MFKNSRDVFERFLTELVPARGLKLAKSRPAYDFAIYRYGPDYVALACLAVSRRWGTRKFDGIVGIATGDSVSAMSRGRIQLGLVRGLHIANIPVLLSKWAIRDGEEEESVDEFLDALELTFHQLLTEPIEPRLSEYTDVILRPVR